MLEASPDMIIIFRSKYHPVSLDMGKCAQIDCLLRKI